MSGENQDGSLRRLHGIDREYRRLERTAAVLQWDQETCLPPGGVEERSEQLALISSIAHGRLTGPETGELLEKLGSVPENPGGFEALPEIERDFLRVMRRNYDRAARLPAGFVGDMARAEGLSQDAWVRARKRNDFSLFLPHLGEMVSFAEKKARYWGFGDGKPVYDGLLDIYEPGLTVSQTEALFTPLRARLTALLRKIRDRGLPAGEGLDGRPGDFPVPSQARFAEELLDYLGFDRNRGRLDISAHPFTTSLGGNDIRITTRYFPGNPLSGIFSVIHETGHAFYEMGFSEEIRESCLADGASMAFHESQSRFWENVIGRSLPFWQGLYPRLRARFPDQLGDTGVEAFWRQVNRIVPTPIRVDADEVSYSLHIILRFELEKAIFAGELELGDLPGIWREKMREYLDMDCDTDSGGVLQDVHWSMGSFGYFPSYALGNLYGLQIARKIRGELPGLDGQIASGNFAPLRSWLDTRIYRWGCRLTPAELLMKITGETLSIFPFVEYLEAKYTELYGI